MTFAEFVNLVDEMLLAQQDYFHAKRQGKPARDLLIKARALENRVRAFIGSNKLRLNTEKMKLDQLRMESTDEKQS